MAAPRVVVAESEKEVAEKLCAFVIEKANIALSEKGTFYVGVSGGSLPKFLCDGLPHLKTNWNKWKIFFCDERHVPYNDPECTYSIYKTNLVDKVSMLPDNIFPIDPNVSVEEAAMKYDDVIRKHFPGVDIPRFDLLLLGMGPDGHTCSLFPGHKLLQETEKIIAPISDSPKPPPARVTMTLPLINNCKFAVFTSCGAGKKEVIQQVLEGNEPDPLPAARVRPTNGELVWFLDKAAAQLLCKV
ncbi:hypothetical protein CHS0354_001617 [Potamilus streckersoni]|uniref:6-phosphogluconolactonase n=1 Tax=Potamilus streckersoni TaxID=2493646 RepID=A0AAE0SEV9_9BIVA|nr:hypothetical protein CHS0354_001617 [Potamilus streckersoni]